MTPYFKSGLSTTVTSVFSGQAGYLEAIEVYNPSNAAAFVQIFDAGAIGDVTLNTTVPNLSIGMETLTHTQLSNLHCYFAKGLQIAATTTATGNSAPNTGLMVNLIVST